MPYGRANELGPAGGQTTRPDPARPARGVRPGRPPTPGGPGREPEREGGLRGDAGPGAGRHARGADAPPAAVVRGRAVARAGRGAVGERPLEDAVSETAAGDGTRVRRSAGPGALPARRL